MSLLDIVRGFEPEGENSNKATAKTDAPLKTTEPQVAVELQSAVEMQSAVETQSAAETQRAPGPHKAALHSFEPQPKDSPIASRHRGVTSPAEELHRVATQIEKFAPATTPPANPLSDVLDTEIIDAVPPVSADSPVTAGSLPPEHSQPNQPNQPSRPSRPSQPGATTLGPSYPIATPAHRRLAGAGAILVALHLGAMYLWIAPENAMSRALSPALASYVLPAWQQSWSLFAPTPVHAGYYLEVRSQPRASGNNSTGNKDTTSTNTATSDTTSGSVPASLTASKTAGEGSWIDASDTELQGLRGHLLPTTAINITNKLASGINEHVNGLSTDQKEVFGQDFIEQPWDDMTGAVFSSPDKVTDSFAAGLIWDRAATAYATQYLRASANIADSDLVQYQIVRVTAPPFDKRDKAEPQRSVVFTSGLRPQTVIIGQDETAFKKALESF